MCAHDNLQINLCLALLVLFNEEPKHLLTAKSDVQLSLFFVFGVTKELLPTVAYGENRTDLTLFIACCT